VAVKKNLDLAREGRKKILSELAKVDKGAAQEVEALAEPLDDKEYPDHESLLQAEMQRGQVLVEKGF